MPFSDNLRHSPKLPTFLSLYQSLSMSFLFPFRHSLTFSDILHGFHNLRRFGPQFYPGGRGGTGAGGRGRGLGGANALKYLISELPVPRLPRFPRLLRLHRLPKRH